MCARRSLSRIFCSLFHSEGGTRKSPLIREAAAEVMQSSNALSVQGNRLHQVSKDAVAGCAKKKSALPVATNCFRLPVASLLAGPHQAQNGSGMLHLYTSELILLLLPLYGKSIIRTSTPLASSYHVELYFSRQREAVIKAAGCTVEHWSSDKTI